MFLFLTFQSYKLLGMFNFTKMEFVFQEIHKDPGRIFKFGRSTADFT